MYDFPSTIFFPSSLMNSPVCLDFSSSICTNVFFALRSSSFSFSASIFGLRASSSSFFPSSWFNLSAPSKRLTVASNARYCAVSVLNAFICSSIAEGNVFLLFNIDTTKAGCMVDQSVFNLRL